MKWGKTTWNSRHKLIFRKSRIQLLDIGWQSAVVVDV
jgi:hypothetical protein